MIASIGIKLRAYAGYQPPIIWNILIPIMTVVFALIVISLLWKSTNSLLKKEITPDTQSADLSAGEIMNIVFACLGVYFVVDAAIVLPHSFVNLQVANNTLGGEVELAVTYLLAQVIELIFGFILIKSPMKLLTFIRSIGEKKSQPVV
jgi:hypothetical protein